MNKTTFTEEEKYLRAKKKVKEIKGFYIHLSVYLAVNGFVFISKLVEEGSIRFLWERESYGLWFFWGIGLFFHGFGVFGMDFLLGKKWEENKIKEIMNRDKTEYWE
ncbi:MAG: 2TM domain-containing protein [Flavobacteriaceae bacterium]|nr:2TM domain-containing protein [Flavobacteriaceae bacterium]